MAVRDQNPELYQDLQRRLKRIEGQARGLQRLLEEGVDCDQVVIQIAAMKAALSKVGVRLAACQLGNRMKEEINQGGDGTRALDESLEVFNKLS
ncbi:MAG TPA: metal-sensitive transcriptional regulator [Symbiobacteriaceae bacterium]|nr:metal-sensitive transcriptional regulator [Symbiobacteriaceae bacterium]